MSLNLLDRLISDIIGVTQTIIAADPVDMKLYATSSTSIEKKCQSKGLSNEDRDKAENPMTNGVHRTVC